MGGKAVAKRVGMDGMAEARTPSGSLAGMARCFLVDWVIGSMPTVAGKEPIARSESSIDESCDFFLTEDRRQAMALFRIRSFRNAPGLLECLDVEESQSRQAVRNCTRRQLLLLKQLGLILANVLQA